MHNSNPDVSNMKPCGFGSREGLPAMQWWRRGVAARGEPAVVFAVTTYETEAARSRAYLAAVEPKVVPLATESASAASVAA